MVTATLIVFASIAQVNLSVADSALIDGEKVHLFLPPVLVCEGRWLSSQWSDDGQYLIVVSEHSTIAPGDYREYFESGKTTNSKTDVKVAAFSMRTGRARELWSVESRPLSRADCVFFRNSDVAIVSVTQPDSKSYIVRVTASTSKAEIVETLASAPHVTVYANKLAAVCVDE